MIVTQPRIEKIAQFCHEANRAYCQMTGDFSQKCWEEAEEWQKESARKGVIFVIDNPTGPVSATHDSWLEEKRATGWKFGPVKDPAKKEHPCFVPYSELPERERIKDYIFKSIVLAFLEYEEALIS